jgi:hypothetical protein
MRAFTLDSFGAQPALRDDIPEPRPGNDELLSAAIDSSKRARHSRRCPRLTRRASSA